MSVLNQSGEEQVECPLCMEPLEVDDLNFFPCTCGYQICRFCWHRIRTDENGLCPACRKAYSENPADFTPLSREQVAQLKAEKRQRDQQRKAKLSESRKHLASVRVVQKNLVFVVGLPLRLADPEILKRHEYFGKFGKIHKVVINQSTSYAGSQGPSASAYVTYVKSEDALRAIQTVNNIALDGRLIKSSLGTTKYCSHFMKNQPCPKPDCMYLHDFGDPEASFTKEQMHAGKHQEYEKKLHDSLLNKAVAPTTDTKQPTKCKESASSTASSGNTNGTKENWPQLNEKSEKTEKKPDKTEKRTEKSSEPPKEKSQKKTKTKSMEVLKKIEKKSSSNESCQNISQNLNSHCNQSISPNSSSSCSSSSSSSDAASSLCNCSSSSKLEEKSQSTAKSKHSPDSTDIKLAILDDNTSFFSQNTFQKIQTDETPLRLEDESLGNSQILNDTPLDINSSEDWEAAFGFSNFKNNSESFSGHSFSSQNEPIYPKFNHLDSYQNGYDIKDSLLEVLNKNNYAPNDRLNYGGVITPQKEVNGLNGLNGGHDMSKFFEYYKNGQKEMYGMNGITQNGLAPPQHNTLNHSSLPTPMTNILSQPNLIQNSISQTNLSQLAMHQQQQPNNIHSLDKQTYILLQQQRQIEEQLMNLGLKQNNYGQQPILPNGLSHNGQYMNGDVLNSTNFGLHNQLYHNSQLNNKNTRNHAEDELDFDPFQETQKALAELIENEQNHKLHNSGRGNVGNSTQLNGLVHNQNSNHLPPPPPGFIQPNTHMNSFGSKILPYLNMGSTQQQQQNQQLGINGTTQNSWSGSYNSQLTQQQHKAAGIGACNDWKVLDPAIVSSSRHFPLANLAPFRDQYNLQQRTFDYTASNSFTNFSQQLQQQQQQQPNGCNFLNTQQNLNWLGNELNSQISSPPGFRAGAQATKQQEC